MPELKMPLAKQMETFMKQFIFAALLLAAFSAPVFAGDAPTQEDEATNSEMEQGWEDLPRYRPIVPSAPAPGFCTQCFNSCGMVGLPMYFSCGTVCSYGWYSNCTHNTVR